MSENENDFSLSSLIPDPLTYTDDRFEGDGKRYDMLRAEMLSAEDYAAIQRITREITAISAGKDAGSPAKVKIMEQRLEEFIALLIPGLPAQRVHALPLVVRIKVIEWWKSKHPEQPPGEAPAVERTQRKRSPASSVSTAKASRTT